MSASLVGSEMCIRDRGTGPGCACSARACSPCSLLPCSPWLAPGVPGPVSYTHLTLPTICSV
eukprot:10015091-Alexandrium_andersonii.AAC.1